MTIDATRTPMDRYDAARRRHTRPSRSALGYWVPLVLTVTIASAGLAAWIWSERQQDGDDDDDNDRNDDKDDKDQQDEHPTEDTRHDAPSESRSHERDQGFLARMTRRTPSPQQFLDKTGQRIAAGVAAAGAAVGLSGASRPDEREAAFSDHERWNEEAENKRSRKASSTKNRRTVAVVLSAHSPAEEHQHGQEMSHRTDHAVSSFQAHILLQSPNEPRQSILSHLPHRFNPSTTRLFVLIYAPNLNALPPTNSTPLTASTNLSSSYAAITSSSSSSPVMVPTTPAPSSPDNPVFDALHTQALSLVDKPSMILPFSHPTGYVHILRHLSPSLVYLSDSPELCGSKGDHVALLKGWVGQTILVVGDDGHGGLADTETEDEGVDSAAAKWWQGSDMIGLGKDVEVVDADRVGDDWTKRLAE